MLIAKVFLFGVGGCFLLKIENTPSREIYALYPWGCRMGKIKVSTKHNKEFT